MSVMSVGEREWGMHGLRRWSDSIEIAEFPRQVWDLLLKGPSAVGVMGKVRDFQWLSSPGPGSVLRFKVTGVTGGEFVGVCLECEAPRVLTVLTSPEKGSGGAAHSIEAWVESVLTEESTDAIEKPRAVVTHRLEDLGGRTRVTVELWGPDDQVVFKSDPFMRVMMSLIAPPMYRSHLRKHLRSIRAGVRR